MLTLPIKRPWFDMIRSGEKTEEYRCICPYWTKRFETAFGMTIQRAIETRTGAWITFRNGYSEHAPRFNAEVCLRIGEGRPEWGAEPGTEYYILEIRSIFYLYWKEVSR